MDTKGKQIAYQVAYKAAVELISAGVVQLETEDTGAEVAGFASALFDHLEAALLTLEGAKGNGSGPPSASSPGKSSATSPRSPRSPRAASATPKSSSGSRKAAGDFEFASAGQCKFIEKMIGEKDHEIEYTPDGFTWGDELVPWDKIPSGFTQDIIDYLKPLNDLEAY